MKFVSPLTPGWIKARLYHLLAPLVMLVALWLLSFTNLIELLENLTINLRFQVRANSDPQASDRLLLVAIDQQSIDFFGAWPWPRTIEAEFLGDLAHAEKTPHTVAFDLLFTDTFDKFKYFQTKDGVNVDEELGKQAGLLPSVISGALSIDPVKKQDAQRDAENRTRADLALPSLTQPISNVLGDKTKLNGSSVAIFPITPLLQTSVFGFVDDHPSRIDGIRRTIPLMIRVNDKVFPSFALQTLCQMLNVDVDNVEVDLSSRTVTLVNSSHKVWTIPINEKGEYAINYRAQSKFSGCSFVSLMSALERHEKAVAKNLQDGTPVPPLETQCEIGNKILVIGQAATGLTDLGPTPLQAESPLVYTHLNVINNVLNHDYLTFVPLYQVIIGWLIVTLFTLFRLKDAHLIEAVAVPIAVMCFYVFVSFYGFWVWSLQIAIAWPVLGYGTVVFGGVVLRWREEQQSREQLLKVFSHMVSPEIMNHLLEHPKNLELGGEDRASTILFSDIRDYTKFSEGLEAAEVVRQLNIYFERMFGCVTICKGTFHKFIGDAIMAAWGDIALVSQGFSKDARNAVRASLMMRQHLRELNTERQQEGLSLLRFGIGLNHGIVQAGMLGATTHREFTVMGDEVNTASRLEGMTKEFHTDLAISESVRRLIGDDFLVRRLGLIVLKGKTQATVVYEVLAETSDLASSKMTPEIVAQYETAFDHFLGRRFAEAELGFTACEQVYPKDYCIQEYLKAAREFLIKPPPADWDGRIVMKTK